MLSIVTRRHGNTVYILEYTNLRSTKSYAHLYKCHRMRSGRLHRLQGPSPPTRSPSPASSGCCTSHLQLGLGVVYVSFGYVSQLVARCSPISSPTSSPLLSPTLLRVKFFKLDLKKCLHFGKFLGRGSSLYRAKHIASLFVWKDINKKIGPFRAVETMKQRSFFIKLK